MRFNPYLINTGAEGVRGLGNGLFQKNLKDNSAAPRIENIMVLAAEYEKDKEKLRIDAQKVIDREAHLKKIGVTAASWRDLEPELHEQILRHAQPAPTATVEYSATQRVGDVEVPVIISFQFTRAHSQRLARHLLSLRTSTQISPRLRITVSRRLDTTHLKDLNQPLPPETEAQIEFTKHWNNIACIRLHEDSYGIVRYTFEFIGASQAQSYHAPEWAWWDSKVFARNQQVFTDELGMTFKQTPRTATSGVLLEFTFDT